MNRYARNGPRTVHREPQPEKAFQAQVVELAQWMGYKLIYHTVDSRKSAPGWPDLVLVKIGTHGSPTRMVCLELKAANGKPSVAQLAWIAALESVPGVDAMIAYPRDLERIRDLLA